MSDRPEPPRGEHFEEAIARWHLQVQTEVKRSSSLPTAMFDACDPGLEARLTEATERIIGMLREHPPMAADEPASDDHRHLEVVDERELQALVRRLHRFGTEAAPRLDEGQRNEYLAVLADLCCAGDAAARRDAAARIRRDFDIGEPDNLEQLTAALAHSLRHCVPTVSATDEQQLDRLCRDIAHTAAGILASASRAEPPR